MAESIQPLELGPGSSLGHFKILTYIGAGGMGVVFKAQDERLGRPVALKVLSRELFENDLARSRFLREAQITAAISHPHVATVHEIDEQNGILFIAMEWVPGSNLKELLRSGPMRLHQVLSIGQQVCSALESAHHLGVVHRDVKSSNVMITPEGEAKVLDFGLAKAVAESELFVPSEKDVTREKPIREIEFQPPPGKRRSTALGVAVGTPYYMSPEQASGKQVDARSDIFSLGVVLYEAASGQLPFEGASDAEVLESIRSKDPTPLQVENHAVPSAFSDVVRTCLEKKPERRYPSAAVLQETLHRLEQDLFAKWHAGLSLFLAFIYPRKLAAALILMAVALAVWQLLPPKPPDVPPGTRIVLADIENLTQDAELSAVQTLLEIQLRQSAHMRVLTKTAVRDTLQRMVLPAEQMMDLETVQEVAWREAIPLALTGSLFQVGSNYVLAMRLDQIKDSPAPAKTWSKDFRAPGRDDLYEAVDQASWWVRSTVGETAEELVGKNVPAQETTASWEALNLFTRAEAAWYGGRTEDARLLLKEAVSLDPDFAMGWARLADISYQHDLNEVFSYHQTALDAMKHRRVTKYEELRIKSLYAIDAHDYLTAERLFRTFSLSYPNDYQALSGYGYSLNFLGREKEALSVFQEAEILNPQAYQAVVNVALTHLMLNQFDDVTRYINRLEELESYGWADELRGTVQFLKGEYDAALRTFAGMSQSPDLEWQSKGYSLLASVLGEMGRLEEAAEALEEGMSIDAQRGQPSDQAQKRLALGYIELVRGNPVACREVCLRALELESSPNRMLHAGILLARSGFIQEAQDIRSRMENLSDVGLFARAKHRLSGEILQSQGKLEEARPHLQRAFELDGAGNEAEYLARFLATAGDLEGARMLYRDLSNTPARLWRHQTLVEFPGFWADVLLRCAEISLSLGEAEESRAALTLYLDMREQADPGLEDVESARELWNELDR